jgi:hypothetical protein
MSLWLVYNLQLTSNVCVVRYVLNYFLTNINSYFSRDSTDFFFHFWWWKLYIFLKTFTPKQEKYLRLAFMWSIEKMPHHITSSPIRFINEFQQKKNLKLSQKANNIFIHQNSSIFLSSCRSIKNSKRWSNRLLKFGLNEPKKKEKWSHWIEDKRQEDKIHKSVVCGEKTKEVTPDGN